MNWRCRPWDEGTVKGYQFAIWEDKEYGRTICYSPSKTDAEFICRILNAHDKLLAILRNVKVRNPMLRERIKIALEMNP